MDHNRILLVDLNDRISQISHNKITSINHPVTVQLEPACLSVKTLKPLGSVSYLHPLFENLSINSFSFNDEGLPIAPLKPDSRAVAVALLGYGCFEVSPEPAGAPKGMG